MEQLGLVETMKEIRGAHQGTAKKKSAPKKQPARQPDNQPTRRSSRQHEKGRLNYDESALWSMSMVEEEQPESSLPDDCQRVESRIDSDDDETEACETSGSPRTEAQHWSGDLMDKRAATPSHSSGARSSPDDLRPDTPSCIEIDGRNYDLGDDSISAFVDDIIAAIDRGDF